MHSMYMEVFFLMVKKKSTKEEKKELKKRIVDELWKRGDLSYKYHSGQKKIVDTLAKLPKKAREILLLISRRWGKSFLGALLSIETAQGGYYRRVLIMGPTEKQTKDIINPILNKIKIDDHKNLLKETKSEAKWKIGRSEIQLAGFDTCIESVRGQEFDLVILEETGSAKVKKEEYDYILKSVLRPTLMHTKGPIIHLTTPSKDADHPLHTITIPKTQKAGTYFEFNIRENPLLTEEEIEEEIEEMGGIDDPSVQRELFCKILRDLTTLAIPKFNKDINVQEFDLPDVFFSWVGGDFGGVRDKTFAHLWAYDFKNAKKLIVAERGFEANTPTSEIAREIRAMEAEFEQSSLQRYIDCPGQTKVDLQNDHGLSIISPKKMKGSFEAGVNQINLACLQEKVIIHPRCTETILALENGRFNKQRTDYERTEELGHCDALASMAYGLRHAHTDNPYPALYNYRHVPKDDLFIRRTAEGNPLLKLFDED